MTCFASSALYWMRQLVFFKTQNRRRDGHFSVTFIAEQIANKVW